MRINKTTTTAVTSSHFSLLPPSLSHANEDTIMKMIYFSKGHLSVLLTSKYKNFDFIQSIIKNQLMNIIRTYSSSGAVSKCRKHDFNASLSLNFTSLPLTHHRRHYSPIHAQTISFIWHWIDGIILSEMWWHSREMFFFLRQTNWIYIYTNIQTQVQQQRRSKKE